jgi:hypothetical protein
MKPIHYEYLFLSFLLLIAVGFSVLYGSTIMPFDRNHPHLNAYEGFTSQYKSADYSSSSDNKAMDTYKSFLINSDISSTDCKKVFGFDGLFCQPSVADNKIDIFGGAKGSLECTGYGSELSNSNGSICLDDNMKKMLMSRGGNASGGDWKIGT